MEVDAGSNDNSELPAKLPSQGFCRVDLWGVGVGEKSQTRGPQHTARHTSDLFFPV